MTLADRIVVMKDGVIQQEGPPLELYQRPRNLFVAGFLGAPAMNFLRATLDPVRPELDLAGAPVPVLEPAANAARTGGVQTVIAGVRPEDVTLAQPGKPLPGATTGGMRGAQIRGRVEVIEPMGAEVVVHVTTDAGIVVARVPPASPPRLGDAVTVGFDPSRLHLFDTRTEARLG